MNINFWQTTKKASLRLLGFTLIFGIALLVLGNLIKKSIQKAAVGKNNYEVTTSSKNKTAENGQLPDLKEVTLEAIKPSQGVTLPIRWGNLGIKLTEEGVIDSAKLTEIYQGRGGLDEAEQNLLYGTNNDYLKITPENSGFLLNMFWALGLGNKNDILDRGPMRDPRFGGAGNFASTGGWTLAKGDAMYHYSQHSFITLSPERQALVEKVAQNIYRPCCNNSTYFPDCNHGLAMLGFLELMAGQGVGEKEMYKAALAINAYWFPDNYYMIAKFLVKHRNISWKNANPKTVLGADFSSASGYRKILSQMEAPKTPGGSCSI